MTFGCRNAFRQRTRAQDVLEIWSLAQLKDCAERVGINLKHVEVCDDVRMSQPLVDVHLANCVLDVGSLALLLPQIAQLMKLARHLAILLEIHGVPHLRKFTLANQAEQEIPPVEHRRL